MTIQDNLKEIHEQIDRLSTACSVQLLAVSKTFGVEAIAEAIQVGERRFGENYVQENYLNNLFDCIAFGYSCR